MKRIFLLNILFFAFSCSAIGNPFIAEEACVIAKDKVAFTEKVIFKKFLKVSSPKLFEENPTNVLVGTDVDASLLEVPLEFKAGLAENFNLAISTFYIYDMRVFSDPLGTYNLSNNGFSKVSVKGIYLFSEDGEGSLGACLIAGVSIPLGDDDYYSQDGAFKFKMPLGDRGLAISVTEAMSKNFTFLKLHVNLGYEMWLSYNQKRNWKGDLLTSARNIDPGDVFGYNIAIEKNLPGFSVIGELDGDINRDIRVDGVSIAGSGSHTIQLLLGIQIFPSPGTNIGAAFCATVFTSGGNNDFYYGPVLSLSQRL